MEKIQGLQGGDIAASQDTFLGVGSGGWNAIGTVGVTAINVWNDYALAREQAKMKEDLFNFNNKMRAINQSVKQYTTDVNHNAITDAAINEDIQIAIDRMKAVASVEVEAAATGASPNAKRSALFDINRNALQAKMLRDTNYERTLEQLKLNEYSDTFSGIQQTQKQTAITKPSLLQGAVGSTLKLGKQSIDSGAWDSGSPLMNWITDKLKSNGSTATLTD